MTVPAELATRAREWIESDPDPATRAELEALLTAGATDELHDRFRTMLAFGTAGLRGALGAGPNRMNSALVRMASAGVAHWLHAHGLAERGVVVGHDHRHGSAQFARDTAGVLAAAGVPVRLATREWPTPVTAYAVRHFEAAAGVMITASHNPAPDNGYKVYDASGSQIIPPSDTEIAAAMERAGPARAIPSDPDHALVQPLGAEVIEAYLRMAGQVIPAGVRNLRVVYTPVHGVGLDVFTALWARAGFPPATVVDEQAAPDPDFPTAFFPNPEEPGVLDLALAHAQATGADLVLANDPDADRLAVAIPDRDGGGFRRLSGDEIGALLGAHMLAVTEGDDRIVARSIVSSRMLDRIAADAGVPCAVTPTGFKWVSRGGDAHGQRLVFGYEEALGYAVTPAVRDKDGLTAALAFGDLAARGSIEDALADLARRYGLHATAQWSMRFPDPDGAAAFTDAVRADPPRELAGTRVTAVEDYAAGRAGFPPTDLVVLELDGGGRVLVRPSGTEPKVKCYFEAVEPVTDGIDAARRAATERLKGWQAALLRTLPT